MSILDDFSSKGHKKRYVYVLEPIEVYDNEKGKRVTLQPGKIVKLDWTVANEVWVSIKDITEQYLEGHKEAILDNAKVYKNCAVSTCDISTTDLEEEDARIIIVKACYELLKTKNVEAAFVIYELVGVVNII